MQSNVDRKQGFWFSSDSDYERSVEGVVLLGECCEFCKCGGKADACKNKVNVT